MRYFILAALLLFAGNAQAAPPLEEAAAFMASYAEDLRTGNRPAIAGRYDRSGAWRVGDGVAELENWDRIAAVYASERWQPPAAFEWQGLAYEPAGPDAVVVVGRFAWTPAVGQPPLVFSYTALLVRQDGALRIRLENESAAAR